MKRYRVKQYEVHTQSYEVEAESEAEAVKRILDGEGDPILPTQYYEIDESRGLGNSADTVALITALDKLGVGLGEDGMVPSIHSVELIEEEA